MPTIMLGVRVTGARHFERQPTQSALRGRPPPAKIRPFAATSMSFTRFGHLDDRRRRVLTDEVIGSAPTEVREPKNNASRTGVATGDAWKMPTATRLVDLVPRRYLTLALWFFAGLLTIAALEGLYYLMPRLAQHASDGRIAAFDLDDEGSLAAWFSSTTLLLASLTAWLVYGVRRHKPDDYHGRFRIWLGAGLLWMLMSIDEAASLHEGFKELMTQLTHRRLWGDGSVWWVGAYLIVLGVIGLRLLLEMRVCRAATTALALAAVAYGAAVAVQLGWLAPDQGARAVMWEEGLEMLGNLWLLLSMSLSARYVILESEGQLPRRAKVEKPATEKRKARVESKPDTGSGTDGAARTSQSGKPVLAARRVEAGRPAAETAHPRAEIRLDAEETTPRRHSLSKAERKALRRSQREDHSSYEDDE